MHPTGHRGAHGQGARSQADAQGWGGESGRTHSACHYTLAGFSALKGLANAFEALGTRRAIAEASGKRTPSRRDVLLRTPSRRKFASKLFRLSIQGFRLAPLALAPSRSARRSAAQNKGNSQADYYQRTQDYERQIHGQRL